MDEHEEERFNRLSGEAREHLRTGNYRQADRTYKMCLSLSNLNPIQKAAIHSNLSYVNLLLCEWKQAENNANLSIKYNPTWEKGYFRLGEVLKCLGAFDAAANAYEAALKLAQDNKDLAPYIEFCRTRQADLERLNAPNPFAIPLAVGAAAGFLIFILVQVLQPSSRLNHHPIETAVQAFAFLALGAAVGFGGQLYSRTQTQKRVRPLAETMAEHFKAQQANAGPQGEGGEGRVGEEEEEKSSFFFLRKRSKNTSKRNRDPTLRARKPPTVFQT